MGLVASNRPSNSSVLVQKYGGTSVGSADRLRAVATRCLAAQRAGKQVVVVVSAMAGETNRLLGLAHQLNEGPCQRELDMISATGEQVSAGLLALAIEAQGGQAVSLLGHQVRILTDSAFARARIKSVDVDAVLARLALGKVVVVAGFQGVDADGNITTLGRGGSDTTAVAIAAALNADACEIYTDVEGVFTADPNVVPNARKLGRISYECMLELSSLGAKVLQLRSVEFGMKYEVPIHVRSSFSDAEGTWVVKEEFAMEDVVVAAVTATDNEAKITIGRLPEDASVQSRILRPLANAGIVVDVIVQALSPDGRATLSFTLPASEVKRARHALVESCPDLFSTDRTHTVGDLSKVSVVGVGMRSHAGVALRMFEILAKENIRVHLVSTSEIKISCVIDCRYKELAVRALHEGFGLGRGQRDQRESGPPTQSLI
jgi:aspartate kinase